MFKSYKFTTTVDHLKYSECVQTMWRGCGSAPDPAGGAHSAPQTTSCWGGGWLKMVLKMEGIQTFKGSRPKNTVSIYFYNSKQTLSNGSDISTPHNTLPILGPQPVFKSYKFTTTVDHLKYSECMQTMWRGCGSAQTPLGELTALPRPLAGGEGAGCLTP